MMFTPCWPSAGPTGGAGLAAPAWICNLMIAVSFFFGGMLSFLSRWVPRRLAGRLDLGDLAEGQFDRRLPAEDGDQDLQLLVQAVDLADGGRQGGEGAVHDRDGLADLEVDDLDGRLAGGRAGLPLTLGRGLLL